VKLSRAVRRTWWALVGLDAHPPSLSLERSPASSPRLKPVVAAAETIAASSGWPRSSAVEMSCLTGFGTRDVLRLETSRWRCRPAVAAVDNSPQFTACRNAADRMR